MFPIIAKPAFCAAAEFGIQTHKKLKSLIDIG